MKISRQNLQKEGYMVPKTESCEIRQDVHILAGSSIKSSSVVTFSATPELSWGN